MFQKVIKKIKKSFNLLGPILPVYLDNLKRRISKAVAT